MYVFQNEYINEAVSLKEIPERGLVEATEILAPMSKAVENWKPREATYGIQDNRLK